MSQYKLPADHPHYRQPAPIDWTGELEAVHEDGRVVPVQLAEGQQPDGDGDYCLREFLETRKGVGRYFKADGLMSYTITGVGRPWRIRNVTPQPTPQADTKPDVTARMEALVRAIAADSSSSVVVDHQDEARAIVALLPEPVDPDLIEAREVCREVSGHDEYADGSCDNYLEMQCARAALARGRELALAGEAGK